MHAEAAGPDERMVTLRKRSLLWEERSSGALQSVAAEH